MPSRTPNFCVGLKIAQFYALISCYSLIVTSLNSVYMPKLPYLTLQPELSYLIGIRTNEATPDTQPASNRICADKTQSKL